MTMEIQRETPTESGEFRRIEDKYIIPMKLKEKVQRNLMANGMRPSFLENDTYYTLIESIYFDSERLDFYRDHLNSLPLRYKMRIRRYAPNGVWSAGEDLLEIKMKDLNVSKKFRFNVSRNDFNEYLTLGHKLPFSERFVEINGQLKGKTLLKRLRKVNGLIERYNPRPFFSIQYKRFAYENSDGLRLTLDSDLEGKDLGGLSSSQAKSCYDDETVKRKSHDLISKHTGQGVLILEVKHQGLLPEWLNQLIQELELQKTSFSKYCWFASKRIHSLLEISH